MKAEVTTDLIDVRYGWKVVPNMSGRKFRATLIHGPAWYVMELCESLEQIIDLQAQFHGFAGNREILTMITDVEKAPQLMGFRLLDDADIPIGERRQREVAEDVVLGKG